MTQAKILISGATGNVGIELTKGLAASDTPFRALVRNVNNSGSLKNLPQAEIINGDLADESRLVTAMQGIEKAFLLSNSSEQAEHLQLTFVKAAQRAGVKHIVKLSQFAADEHSPVRFLRYHARVENRIRELGFSYTFLRPNLFMQGLLAFKDSIKKDGMFYASIGNAAISAVDVRNISAVATHVLTETGHENKIYNITGGEAITHYQMADILSHVLGRKVSFVNVTPDQMQQALKATGFPEWQAAGLIEDYAHYARGEAATTYDTVTDVTNVSPVSFEQFAEDYKEIFGCLGS